MTDNMKLRVGDWVEIRAIDEIRATLDEVGELEHLPFMPEMAPHCGQRLQVSAVMTKICGGGGGMKGVLGGPLVLLDDLRCYGAAHGGCSRQCTILWKPAWLRPLREYSPGKGTGSEKKSDAGERLDWPYPMQTTSGAYRCQATALPRATVPVSKFGKVVSAFDDVRRSEWSLGQLVRVYLDTLSHRVGSSLRRLKGAIVRKKPTPVEKLGLVPGEWVQVKSLDEISGTLDRNWKNRGLEFSRYMIPFCGKTFRVRDRMENFLNEWTGELRKLENTVLLQDVTCGGETTSGPCRRAEYLYWREIWLRRVEAPVAATQFGRPPKQALASENHSSQGCDCHCKAGSAPPRATEQVT